MASEGEEAISFWQEYNPDLVLLDLMLPNIDGLSLLKIFRQKDERLPILILSAKNAAVDKVKALGFGADDYLAKPFYLEELLIRVSNLLKKKDWYSEDKDQPRPFHSIQIGDYTVDFDKLKVTGLGKEISLTIQEMKLLKVFIGNPDRALSRKEILEMAWGYDEKVETRTLDNFIVRFRKYFDDNPKVPRHFKSVRSIGYIFEF